MNDDAVKELVRERRLSAELAAVMDARLSVIDAIEAAPRKRSRSWLAAAVLVLGVGAAVGVAVSARHDRDQLQQRQYDAVDPWYENEWPWRVPFDVVKTRADVAKLPADRTRFTVVVRDEEGEQALGALLERERIEQLMLMTGGVGNRELRWSELGKCAELRSLLVAGPAAGLDPASLRQLRVLPQLETLALSQGAATLDEATARALVELPKLRQLTCAMSDVSPAGVAALRGLPHLDTLFLHFDPEQARELGGAGELLAAAATVTTLRALFLEGRSILEPDDLRSLHALEHLVVLGLSHVRVNDAALAALPAGLQALRLPRLDGVTSAGLAHLGKLRQLRSLALHGGQLPGALCKVIEEMELECFECLAVVPDATLWEVLQGEGRLRRLYVHTGSSNRAAVWAEAMRCRELEVLIVRVDSLPAPAELAALRGHPKLRLLRLVRYRPTTPVPTPAEVAALRAQAGVEVDVR